MANLNFFWKKVRFSGKKLRFAPRGVPAGYTQYPSAGKAPSLTRES